MTAATPLRLRGREAQGNGAAQRAADQCHRLGDAEMVQQGTQVVDFILDGHRAAQLLRRPNPRRS